MFCKKCGREIKEGVKFCPGCGAQVTPPAKTPSMGASSTGTSAGASVAGASSGGLLSAGIPAAGTASAGSLPAGLSPSSPTGALSPGTVPVFGTNLSPGGNSSSRNMWKYIAVSVIVLVLAAAVAAVFFVLRPKSGKEDLPEEEYSVTGTWASDDMEDLGDIVEDILYDSLLEDLGGSTARSVSEIVGGALDSFSGELEIVFRDNGALELYVHDVSLEMVSLSYEIIDGSEMKLTMKIPPIPVPQLGNIEIPPVSYKAGYDIGKKWLTLDFFGHELEFTRKK